MAKKAKKEKLSRSESYVKPTAKQIAEEIKKGYVVFYGIDWDTDGEETDLPKAVRVPKKDFDKDFDFEQEGADYLSDEYEYCVNGFNFKK